MKTVQDFINRVDEIAKRFPDVFDASIMVKGFDGKLYEMDNSCLNLQIGSIIDDTEDQVIISVPKRKTTKKIGKVSKR